MVIKNTFLKCEQPAQYAFIILIFISIIITLNSICDLYNKWHNNRQLTEASLATPPSLRTSPAATWRLSARPVANAQPAAANNNSDTFLSGIILSGIIFSSDSNASRAILKEGVQQNIYTVNQPLRSAPTVRIVAIAKNQVSFSRAGEIKKLTLLKSISRQGYRRASSPALAENTPSVTQLQDVKEN